MLLYLSCQQGHLLCGERRTYGNNYRSVCKPYFIAYAPASFLDNKRTGLYSINSATFLMNTLNVRTTCSRYVGGIAMHQLASWYMGAMSKLWGGPVLNSSNKKRTVVYRNRVLVVK